MNTKKRDFDKEATTWDEHPARIKLAKDIASALSRQIALTSEMDLLDFGCGTGLLAMQLQPLVRSVTGMDSSEGMLDIFKKKIAKLNLNNISTSLVDLDKGDTLAGNYALVVSNMTLHHIKEIKPLFDQFYEIITPGGYLCIADLDLDEGQFHEDNTGVFHYGFDRGALQKIFTDAGFDPVRDIDAAEVIKPVKSGDMRTFSIFLMTGRKRMDEGD